MYVYFVGFLSLFCNRRHQLNMFVKCFQFPLGIKMRLDFSSFTILNPSKNKNPLAFVCSPFVTLLANIKIWLSVYEMRLILKLLIVIFSSLTKYECFQMIIKIQFSLISLSNCLNIRIAFSSSIFRIWNDFSLLMNMKSSKSLFNFFTYYLYGTQNGEEKCLLCAHKKDLFFSFFSFYSSTNGKISATKARVTTLTLLFFTSSFQVPMGKKPQGILHFFSFIYSMV